MPATGREGREEWSDGHPVILTDEHGKKYEIDTDKHTFKEVKGGGGFCALFLILPLLALVGVAVSMIT